jgi:hypothetical protein
MSSLLEQRRLWDKARYKRDRIKRLEAARAYYQKNKNKIRLKNEKKYKENKAGILLRNLTWRTNNRSKCSLISVEYGHKMYHTDINYRLRRVLRSRIRKFVLGKGNQNRTTALVGCSIGFLKTYLSTQFKFGMTWGNYGKIWHIDHIRPCASFDLTNCEQQKQCFNFRNLQPLFALENLQKGARWN